MLQQTTVATVSDYFLRFQARWPNIRALAQAEEADVLAEWAGLGYYARARNMLKCARTVVRDHGGKFPQAHEELIKLPGIGPYTAAAISAIAFDRPATVVDGNVERVMSRYFAVSEPIQTAKPQLFGLAEGLTPAKRPGDYAQAVMDLGATVCTPKTPNCHECPVSGACKAFERGVQNALPKKAERAAKPVRNGLIYVARDTSGNWLLERRPDRGLLAGTLGWPGSDWGPDPTPAAPLPGNWRETDQPVKHTFTHFHLKLTVFTLTVPPNDNPASGKFTPAEQFKPRELPTVMRKVFAAASTNFK